MRRKRKRLVTDEQKAEAKQRFSTMSATEILALVHPGQLLSGVNRNVMYHHFYSLSDEDLTRLTQCQSGRVKNCALRILSQREALKLARWISEKLEIDTSTIQDTLARPMTEKEDRLVAVQIQDLQKRCLRNMDASFLQVLVSNDGHFGFEPFLIKQELRARKPNPRMPADIEHWRFQID